jgi:hypothetical protein
MIEGRKGKLKHQGSLRRSVPIVEMQRKLANDARMFNYFELKNVGAGLSLELPWAGVSAQACRAARALILTRL